MTAPILPGSLSDLLNAEHRADALRGCEPLAVAAEFYDSLSEALESPACSYFEPLRYMVAARQLLDVLASRYADSVRRAISDPGTSGREVKRDALEYALGGDLAPRLADAEKRASEADARAAIAEARVASLGEYAWVVEGTRRGAWAGGWGGVAFSRTTGCASPARGTPTP